MLDGDVGETDVLLQIGCGAARCDAAHFRAADEHVLIVAGDAALRDLEADELTTDAFFLLARERGAPVEVTLVELGDPTQARFEQRGRLVDLMPVERHRGFEPERVTRSQTARRDAIVLAVAARIEYALPELLRMFGRGVDFKA